MTKHSSPETSQPDVEIYLKDASTDIIQDWLTQVFGNVHWKKQGKLFSQASVDWQNHTINISIFAEAAGKKFTSILFESAHTPWQTDLDCAESAAKTTGLEARCSVGGWTESEGIDEEGWWKVTADGKARIRWG